MSCIFVWMLRYPSKLEKQCSRSLVEIALRSHVCCSERVNLLDQVHSSCCHLAVLLYSGLGCPRWTRRRQSRRSPSQQEKQNQQEHTGKLKVVAKSIYVQHMYINNNDKNKTDNKNQANKGTWLEYTGCCYIQLRNLPTWVSDWI